MTISYAILVCNEYKEIKGLLDLILNFIDNEDEVVVVVDSNNYEPIIIKLLNDINDDRLIFKLNPLENNFSKQKNFMNSLCSKDYIFNIDADEMISPFLIKNIKKIISFNSETDVFSLARINTVEGITEEYIKNQKWNVNENGWINFPDSQKRIYKNNKVIKWIKPVHEILSNYKCESHLPFEEKYCLIHKKSFDRQKKQNEFYNKI